MAWVVDTCVLIDIADDDPRFGEASAQLLNRRRGEGLVICPVTYVELGPAFYGSPALQDEFLAGVGADWREPWTDPDTQAAHRAWSDHIAGRRRGRGRRRPIADILIGAFALRFDGLLTRNPGDFRPLFPSLPIAQPGRV